MRDLCRLSGLFILFCSFSFATQFEVNCGVIETIKQQNFTPKNYSILEEDFNYIKDLKLYGGLNVLLYAGTPYVNNIFPVGRGSQYLKEKPCLEMCDLIEPYLGFNYRDVSDALHTIRLLGPVISRYKEYLGWTREKAFSQYANYREMIQEYTLVAWDNDRNFIRNVQNLVLEIRKQDEELAHDIQMCANAYEALGKIYDFLHATDSIGVPQTGTVQDIQTIAAQKTAAELCKRYMLCVNNVYLKSFGSEFSPYDRESIEKNPLNNAQRIAISYGKFAHTEYALMFHVTHNRTIEIPPLSAISYYDLCQDCEKLWAENIIDSIIFVSIKSYKDSRTRSRKNPNISLRMVQITQ